MNFEELRQSFSALNASSIFQAILFIVAAYLLNAVVSRLLVWISHRISGQARLYLLATIPLVRLIITLATGIVLIPLFIEPSFDNLVTILGAAGLALGFAFKDYASSLIAGVVTLYEMPYRQGDWIQINDTYGEVKQVGLRTYKIITPDDTAVIVPHLKIWDNLTYNANDGSPNLLCVAHFYIAENHNSMAVQGILRDVAISSPYLYLEREVVIIVNEEAYATHYRIKAYPRDLRDQFIFVSDLTLRAKQALSKRGISTSKTLPSISQ